MHTHGHTKALTQRTAGYQSAKTRCCPQKMALLGFFFSKDKRKSKQTRTIFCCFKYPPCIHSLSVSLSENFLICHCLQGPRVCCNSDATCYSNALGFIYRSPLLSLTLEIALLLFGAKHSVTTQVLSNNNTQVKK